MKSSKLLALFIIALIITAGIAQARPTTINDRVTVEQGGSINFLDGTGLLLEGVEVTCSPAKLTYKVKIRSATETLSLQVAVEVATPAAWAMAEDPTWKDYVLVTNPASEWRPTLTVVGSKRDLLPENIRAYVRLTDDDKKPVEGWFERPVSVDLSPGTSLRLQGDAPTVLFRLEKRPAPVAPKPKPASPPLVDSDSAN